MPSSRRSRRRPYGQEHPALDVEVVLRGERTSTGADGSSWTFRRVAGSDKEYRCPGCDQVIAAGTAHVVAWPADHLLGSQAGIEDRRHWHTACWQARDRRRPDRR